MCREEGKPSTVEADKMTRIDVVLSLRWQSRRTRIVDHFGPNNCRSVEKKEIQMYTLRYGWGNREDEATNRE